MCPLRQLSADQCRWLLSVFGEDFVSSSFRVDWWARALARAAGAEGITFGPLVCLRRADSWKAESLFPLVVHELVHVVQYRQLGQGRFLWHYLLEYLSYRRLGRSHREAYLSLSFERQARAIEAHARRPSDDHDKESLEQWLTGH